MIATAKPKKPYPTFPLNAHTNGQWYTTKRIGGCKAFFYFGPWADDPKGERAFDAWKLVADDLRAGRHPAHHVATPANAVTCVEVADRFVSFAEARCKLGEIGPREFDDVRRACMGHFLDAVGETSLVADLDRSRLMPGRVDPVTPLRSLREYLSTRLGVYAFNRNIDKIGRMLRWAHRHELLARRVDDNADLRRESKKAIRRHRRLTDAQNGPPIFTPAECRALVDAAAVQSAGGKSPMLAMILLGLNGGCESSFLSELPIAAVDLTAGFVDWVRPKTEELRRFPLWPVTVKAIVEWIPNRPDPCDPAHRGRMFLTRCGNPFVRNVVHQLDDGTIGSVNPDDGFGKELAKLLNTLGIKRPGLRSHALRRTHATSANNVMDADARKLVMGHGFTGMDPHYVRGVFPAERLAKVTDFVGRELLGGIRRAPNDDVVSVLDSPNSKKG